MRYAMRDRKVYMVEEDDGGHDTIHGPHPPSYEEALAGRARTTTRTSSSSSGTRTASGSAAPGATSAPVRPGERNWKTLLCLFLSCSSVVIAVAALGTLLTSITDGEGQIHTHKKNMLLMLLLLLPLLLLCCCCWLMLLLVLLVWLMLLVSSAVAVAAS